jgi:hypothetical protein
MLPCSHGMYRLCKYHANLESRDVNFNVWMKKIDVESKYNVGVACNFRFIINEANNAAVLISKVRENIFRFTRNLKSSRSR